MGTLINLKGKLGLWIHKKIWAIKRNERVFVPFVYLKHKLKGTSYEEFYAETMNIRSKREPWWGKEDNNIEQLNYLIKHGLKKDMKFLDYGCGALAAGRFIIPYLNPDLYTGVDVSEGVISACHERIKEWELSDKRPKILHVPAGDIQALNGEKFDVIWAQSVLTHCPPEIIKKIILNVKTLLKPDGFFLANFWKDKKQNGQFHYKNWSYQDQDIAAIVDTCDVDYEFHSDFFHPELNINITFVKIRLKS